MTYVWLVLIGIVSGVIGGMGMGGGTLLIPLLTIFMSYSQKIAQGLNLISFLPMSIVALCFHIKNKLVKWDNLLYIIIPGVIFSVGGAFLVSVINGAVLSKIFGAFLIIISFYELFMFFKSNSKKN